MKKKEKNTEYGKMKSIIVVLDTPDEKRAMKSERERAYITMQLTQINKCLVITNYNNHHAMQTD